MNLTLNLDVCGYGNAKSSKGIIRSNVKISSLKRSPIINVISDAMRQNPLRRHKIMVSSAKITAGSLRGLAANHVIACCDVFQSANIIEAINAKNDRRVNVFTK